MLNLQQSEEAFDCFIESACKYMEIGMYDKAMMSLLHINQAIMADSSLLTLEVVKKIDSLYHQLIKKGLVT